MNKYQFKSPTPTGLGTSYYYCYGDNRFENYLNLKNIKYKKLEETNIIGRNLFNEKDKEIEKLNNIIKEIEAIIYNEQLTGIEARLEIQERLDKLQELKGDGSNEEKNKSGKCRS